MPIAFFTLLLGCTSTDAPSDEVVESQVDSEVPVVREPALVFLAEIVEPTLTRKPSVFTARRPVTPLVRDAARQLRAAMSEHALVDDHFVVEPEA